MNFLQRLRQLTSQPPDSFSFRRFCQDLPVPENERTLVYDLMAQGLEDYYHDLYGYHKYGQRPDFLINERMGEPFIFGHAAVHILHHEDISATTKERVARYTLSIAAPGEEFGIPYGLLLPIAFLAARGALRGAQLAQALEMLTYERDVFTGLKADDMPLLADALITQAGLSEEAVRWLRFLLVRTQFAFDTSKALLEAALIHSGLPDPDKQALCHQLIEDRPSPVQRPALQLKDDQLEKLARGEITPDDLMDLFSVASGGLIGDYLADPLTPQFLMRHAIAWLPRLGADPREVVERYLGAGSQYTREAINQGVADVIAAHHSEMPAAFVRQILSQGISHPAMAVRKRFYTVGLDILGPDFIRPALKDRSKKVRQWAEKKLGK